MNIKQAKQEIINTYKAYNQKDKRGEYLIPSHSQRPVLLMGPPGIGKTKIIEQIADELGIHLVSYALTHHTRQSALGLPAITERDFGGKLQKATEYTMSEIIAGIYDKMEGNDKKEGILFLDEINCVSETLMPAMLQLLQQKRFGPHSVPKGWIIVGAGNPPEYNRLARNLDIVTLDRVRVINLEPDHAVWAEYGENSGVTGSILSFLALKKQHFFSIHRDVDGIRYATPRGWEDLSSLIKAYDLESIKVTEEIIKEYISDDDAAGDMAEYLELYMRYKDDYHVEDILSGEAPPKVYERLLDASFDERLTLIRLLLEGLKPGFAGGGMEQVFDDSNTITVGRQLENAFDFIEETMGKNDEMLLFITGLTDNTDAVMYLIMNPSEKYTKYLDELSGDRSRNAILRDI